MNQVENEAPQDITEIVWSEVQIPVDNNAENSSVPKFLGNPRSAGKPTLKNCQRVTPFQLYKTYYTNAVMGMFVENTNQFARNCNIKGWTDVTMNEMHRFHAVLMIFSISCPSDRRMAWDDPLFRMPIVCDIIDRTRFEQIMRAWHLIDTSSLSRPEVVEKNREDPFWTVEPLVKLFTEVAMASFICGQAISVDEQSIPCKCRHSCRCYNTSKPEKWHFKVFSLND